MDLKDYILAAKIRHNLTSDRALDRAIGNKGQCVHFWKNKRSYPSDNAMEKLAELAGQDPDIALLELHFWTAKGSVKTRYRKMAEKLASVAAILLIIIGFSISTRAGTLTEQGTIFGRDNVYYGKLPLLLYKQQII